MEQKYYWIIWIVAVFGFLVISGCVPQTRTQDISTSPNTQTNTCEKLALDLDDKIIDTDNPTGRFVIGGFEGIVGGTLINVSAPAYYVPSDEEQGKATYTMTFKGINKKGDLFLRTSSDAALPYIVGEFYKFDLKNKDQYSMQLSGVFMDPELVALENLQECD